MPVRPLPPNPSLDHLRSQARDLRKGHAQHDPAVGQLIREFHPRFQQADDEAIFAAPLSLSSAQLVIARQHGFPSWPRLKLHVDSPALAAKLRLPHHERIEDPLFRRAVALVDAGDADALLAHLRQHPHLIHQRIEFEGGNYFRTPSLLEFIAENPIRHGMLPPNIAAVATVLLQAGADRLAVDEALGLVATGRIPRECRVQIPLIDLLCDAGADPAKALHPAAAHGEFEAVEALLRRGAAIDLPLAPPWAAAMTSSASFPNPVRTSAVSPSPSPPSSAMNPSSALSSTPASIPTATTPLARMPTPPCSTKPHWPATNPSCDSSSSAARASTSATSCGAPPPPTGPATLATPASKPGSAASNHRRTPPRHPPAPDWARWPPASVSRPPCAPIAVISTSRFSFGCMHAR